MIKQITEQEFLRNNLMKIIGAKITNIVRNSEDVSGLKVSIDGKNYVLWILCDPEGNGPEYLSQEVLCDPERDWPGYLNQEEL